LPGLRDGWLAGCASAPAGLITRRLGRAASLATSRLGRAAVLVASRLGRATSLITRRLSGAAGRVVDWRAGRPRRRAAAAPEQPATAAPGFLAAGVSRVLSLPGLGRVLSYLSGVASSGRPVIVI
jgi:hypothetical protein